MDDEWIVKHIDILYMDAQITHCRYAMNGRQRINGGKMASRWVGNWKN